jgi:hypothetical protein
MHGCASSFLVSDIDYINNWNGKKKLSVEIYCWKD